MWTIVMFLSAVWTLILTAPIHCTGSTGEQESNTTFLQIWDGLRWGYDPWTSKGYNPTFLQTSSDVETNSSTSWMAWEFMFSTFSSIPLKTNTKEESHCQTQTAIRCRIDYMHFLKYKTVVKAFHAHIVLIWPTTDKLAELMDVVTSEMIVYITTSYHIPLCNVGSLWPFSLQKSKPTDSCHLGQYKRHVCDLAWIISMLYLANQRAFCGVSSHFRATSHLSPRAPQSKI